MTAPCTVTWWRNLRDPNGREETLDSWDALFARFERVEPFRGQDEHPGWSPARFDGAQRGKEHVRSVFALCLDYDGNATLDEAIRAWSGTFGLLHTSRRHTPDTPRFRVILPLARPVSPFEYEALWRRVNAAKPGLDPAPKDPSRFWFTPGVGDGGHFEAVQLDGAPLDPDAWLAKPELRTEPVLRLVPPTPGDVERRAIAYLAKMPEAISGSGGHQATWQAAIVLARGFSLGFEATLRILREHYNPRCQPPWSERELEHKARDAARANVADGFLLGDDRGWEPKRYELPPAPRVEPEPAQSEEPRPALERHGFQSMRDLMALVVEEMQKPRPKPGASTGSDELDVAIGGFRAGNVTVFGAKRGFGKTSYGNFVTSLAIPDLKVAMFAGEDAATIYGKRFLAMRAGVNAMMLRDYQCNREDWPKIVKAVNDAPVSPFFVRVEGRPVEWIAKAIREVQAEHGLDLVIVDYLQCLRTEKRLQDRRNEVTYVCKTLSDAIKGAGSAGLIFSQLKRTERTEPEVEDLKESGDIEDMADHILLGWKDGPEGQTVRKIKLGKNKDGLEAGEVEHVVMRWDRRTASFERTPSERGFGEPPPSTLYSKPFGGRR